MLIIEIDVSIDLSLIVLTIIPLVDLCLEQRFIRGALAN